MLRARSLALATLLLATGALAGCTSSEGDQARESRDHEVDGSFTTQATQQDIEALERELEDVGAELVVLESFPMQFVVRGFTGESCQEVLEILNDDTAVDAVGPCDPGGQASNTGNPYSAG